DDARLGERRVDHAVLAEVLLQPVGDPEHAAQLAYVLAHDEDLRVALHGPSQAGVDRLSEGEHLGHRWSLPSNDDRYAANFSRSSSTSGEPSAYTCANRVSGSGSGIASTRSRRCTACLVASASTAAKKSASARPLWARNARTRVTGSLACHASTSLAMRYRVGSSDVVCAPIRYVYASISMGPWPWRAWSSAARGTA